MPAKPSWTYRLPEIIQQLSLLESAVVDRAVCEKIFGLRRRRTVDLMQRFGGYRLGNAVLLDRSELISTLQALSNSPEAIRECKRKRSLSEQVLTWDRYAAARRVQLHATHRSQTASVKDLHDDITLYPGKLIVTFTTAEELFTRLYELAQIAAKDFDDIRETLENIRVDNTA